MAEWTKRLPGGSRRRRSSGVLALAILLAAGCGGGSSEESRKVASGSAPGTEMGPVLATETRPIDGELAESGETLFQEKGCSACHAFGNRVTGPDLAGVTGRRSREWLERMIQEPVDMTREDPTARELLATHLVQMPDLSLDAEQTGQIIEYFRAKDSPDTEKEED